MSGMAGNKGAVAIRMDFASTQLCFVTAHLAAGFANYEERNRDYNTIHHGLRFQRNRGIDNHGKQTDSNPRTMVNCSFRLCHMDG